MPPPPMRPFLDRTAKWVIAHRGLAQVVIAVVCLGCAVGIAELRFELSPESLVAESADRESETDQHRAALREAHRAAFESDEGVALVLFSGHDVLTDEALTYQHEIARWLAERPWARRVASLTTTPLPRRIRERKPTLDGLEAELRAPAGAEAADRAFGPEAEALGALAATSPERFPAGLSSLIELWGERPFDVAPQVEGDQPTEGDVVRIRAQVEAGGLFSERMAAQDESAALVAITLATTTEAETEEAIGELRRHLGHTPPPEGLWVAPAGLPYMQARLVEALETDWEALIMLACLGSLAVLAFGFRSLAGLLLPMSAVGISLAIVTGTMGHVGVPIDLLTNVVPPLLITIGLGDAIHLLNRYREERHGGASPTAAARKTMSAMAVACFITSATTAVGFGSLMISQTEVLRRFGAVASSAVMVAYLVTVIFLPSALPAFPGEERAHRRPKRGHTLDRLVASLAALAMKRRRLVLAVTGVLFVGCLGAAAQVHVDGALLDQFDGSSDTRQTTDILEAKLGGARSFYLVAATTDASTLTGPVLDEFDAIAEDLRAEDGVLRVTTPADLLRETWNELTLETETGTGTGTGTGDDGALASQARIDALAAVIRSQGSAGPSPLARFTTPDGQMTRIEVRLEDRGIRHLNALFDRLEERLGEQDAFDGFIAGEAYRASRGLDRVISDLLVSLALAVLIIFVLIGALFRSPRLALVSVPPNVLPLAAVLAWMAMRGLSLNAATVIVFGVSIGLAVDGTIHVLTRFREEFARGLSTRRSVEAAIAGSGRAVALSSGAVFLGFLALQISGFLPVRIFGELSMVAVVAAFFAELTVLPALLVATERLGRTR